MTWSVSQADAIHGVVPSVDVVITDPPYDAHTHKNSKRSSASGVIDRDLGFAPIGQGEIKQLSQNFVNASNRWIVVFCSDRQAELWSGALTIAGAEVVRWLYWIKLHPSPQFTGDRPGSGVEVAVLAHKPGRKTWNGGGRSNVFAHPVETFRDPDRCHPTQKPLPLMLELVELFSREGETIWDPFCGSGTTGVAATRLGRSFIGGDMDQRWVDLSRERLAAESKGLSRDAYLRGQSSLFT